MSELLSYLAGMAPLLLYLILGVGAALENLFPPIPADTFVLLGAFLAATGRADAPTVFLVTWFANTVAALGVYLAGYRFGRPFFQKGLGRHLLNPRQLRRLGDFYDRWGLPAIFFARFLPGLRAMVPVFAGVARQPFRVVAPPILLASGIWYGALVWAGSVAGRNLPTIVDWLTRTNRILLALAAAVFLGLGIWWLRTRAGGKADEG